jgi:hypothetical protein
MQHAPLKRWLTFNGLHDNISLKTELVKHSKSELCTQWCDIQVIKISEVNINTMACLIVLVPLPEVQDVAVAT